MLIPWGHLSEGSTGWDQGTLTECVVDSWPVSPASGTAFSHQYMTPGPKNTAANILVTTKLDRSNLYHAKVHNRIPYYSYQIHKSLINAYLRVFFSIFKISKSLSIWSQITLKSFHLICLNLVWFISDLFFFNTIINTLSHFMQFSPSAGCLIWILW